MCNNAKGVREVAVFFRGILIGITEYDPGKNTLQNSSSFKLNGGGGKIITLREVVHVGEEKVPADTIGEFVTVFAPRQGRCCSNISLRTAA